jgi:uncharacterized protein
VPGGQLSDHLRVTGLGRTPAQVDVRLFGPFATRAAIRCTGTPFWSGWVAVQGDGEYRTKPVTIPKAGLYTYQERLVGQPLVTGTAAKCAVEAETALVRPLVLTGSGDPRTRAVQAKAPDLPGLRPTRVTVAARGIDAPAVPVGIDLRQGALAAPSDIRKLGWWVDGRPAGARTGSMLIAGHVDSASRGGGAFLKRRAGAARGRLRRSRSRRRRRAGRRPRGAASVGRARHLLKDGVTPAHTVSGMSAPTTGPPSAPEARPAGAPPRFHVLAKPTGAVCNLDCTYCFFLSKEALYPGSRFRMEDTVLEEYVRQLLESHTSSPEVTIAWQGGEPTLMGLEFFHHAVELVERHRRADQTIEHTIQTNGTKLDAEWCAFFREHDFLVGLSIDGPREMHDAYRVDKGGKGTFDAVLTAARLLQDENVEFNVLCTVHAANGDRPLDVYRFFRDELGTKYMQFIPIVERATPELLASANEGWGTRKADRPLYVQDGGLVTERSIRSEQWGAFLIAIFDEWVRHDVGTVFVQLFDAALASWLGYPAAMCIFAETCGDAVALEHTGDLYSCDHFVEPAFKLGNIRFTHMLELLGSEQQRAFGNAKRDTLPQYCRECEVRFACHGECPRNRFISTPDGEPGLNYLCAGYKAFFNHVDEPMKVMADLLRKGRYADEVMGVLDEQERLLYANAGRNDPCPCGSGTKFKQCHGA